MCLPLSLAQNAPLKKGNTKKDVRLALGCFEFLNRVYHSFLAPFTGLRNKHTKVKNYLLLTSEGEKPEKRQKIVKIHF